MTPPASTTPSPPKPPPSTCLAPTSGVDGSPRSQRIAHEPQRANHSVATCCAACDAEPECVAWVMDHADCPQETCVCWLLRTFYPEKAGNRISGGKLTPPSPANGGTVEVVAPDSKSTTLFASQEIGTVQSSLNFPTPVEMHEKSVLAWAIRDGPRFVPSPEGAIPCDQEAVQAACDPSLRNTSGFDTRNNAADVYIFLPGASEEYNYEDLRSEYLKLTGPIPALPNEAFGTWFSWYHAYNQSAAESDIRRWRADDLPIDIWGLDMDWRIWANGMEGKGYFVNTKLFPNISDFYRFAHEHDLVVYMNDHPMANATQLSPQEIKFRYDGLTSLFDRGLDFWWYDENWHNIIPGLDIGGERVDHLVWGQEIFRSITAHYNKVYGPRNTSKPFSTLTLSMYSSAHPAEHRFPVWWTGDVVYTQLLDNIKKMVNGGLSLQPYVHPDCGAHYGVPFKQETPEMFVRWAQFCSMGTIIRFHTNNCCDHRPWTWGKPAEDAIRKTLKMRYTLLPTLISAGRVATATGSPIVKRLDLEWPELGSAGASRDDQYLLVDDILVAPVIPFPIVDNATMKSNASRSVWVPPGSWIDAWSSTVVKGPQTMQVTNVPLDQIPMWHRRGSILITTAPRRSVSEQDWMSSNDPLTIEVFPFEHTSASLQSVSRLFFDTKSDPKHPMSTPITLSQTTSSAGHSTNMSHSALKLSVEKGLERFWRVRVHLLPGERVSPDTVRVYGSGHIIGGVTESVRDSASGLATIERQTEHTVMSRSRTETKLPDSCWVLEVVLDLTGDGSCDLHFDLHQH